MQVFFFLGSENEAPSPFLRLFTDVWSLRLFFLSGKGERQNWTNSLNQEKLHWQSESFSSFDPLGVSQMMQRRGFISSSAFADFFLK